MSIRRRELLVGLVGAVLSFIADGAVAADVPKLKCTRVGQSIIYRNQKFTCVKKGGKLVWNKGVPLPAKSTTPSPSATPTPSATPSATPTPSPTPSATQSPTPSPSASPSASPSKAQIKVAKSSDVPANSVKLISAGANTGLIFPILLLRDNDGLRALQAECPHAGYIVKDNGAGQLVCPGHNSLFSGKDGALLRGPSSYPLERYTVTETGGEIFVTI